MPARTSPHATTRFRVRYAETDQMGVVYHANYLVWCEMGRTELIRSLGTGYADIEAGGLLLAVTDASLRFHKPARYEDEIVVSTWLESVRSRGVSFRYRVSRTEADGEGTLLVSAHTALLAMSREQRPLRLPEALLRRFQSLQAR